MQKSTLIEMIILSYLLSEPRHGYEIKKQMGLIMGRRALANNNQLYPALHRLEEAGAVAGEVREQEGKPSRYIYRMTPLGRELYFEGLSELSEEDAEREDEFLFRLSKFELLSAEQRLAILETRRRILKGRLAHRRSIAEVYPREKESSWLREIFSYEEARLNAELSWIERLERQEEASQSGSVEAPIASAQEVARRYLEAYNTQALQAVMAFVHPDHRYHPPGGGKTMSRDEREADERFFFSAFSDIESVVEEQIAEGDRVASRITMRCTQSGSYQGLPPTGRRIAIAFIDFARVRDAKILEEWAEFDMMGILRQLKPEGQPAAEG